MRLFHTIVLVSLVVLLCVPTTGRGQGYSRARQTPGMFGDRTLGQTLKPRQSQFSAGVQRSPGGSFAGVNRQTTMFTTPWRHTEDISPLIYAPLMPLPPLGPTTTTPNELETPEQPVQPVTPEPQTPETQEPYAPEWNVPQPNPPEWNAPAPSALELGPAASATPESGGTAE